MSEINNQSVPEVQDTLYTINGKQWKSMFEAGMLWLKTNQNIVNALNVFPVPDGDTGTNMLLTMQSAWSDIVLLETEHAGQVMKAAAQGALMGARGNSGVILSQLWRGFSRAMAEYEIITPAIFSKALTEEHRLQRRRPPGRRHDPHRAEGHRQCRRRSPAGLR